MLSLVDTSEDDYDFHINDWLLDMKYADRGKMVRSKPQNFPFKHYIDLMRKKGSSNCITSNDKNDSGPIEHPFPYTSNYSYSYSDVCSEKSSNDARSPNFSTNGSAMFKLYEKLKKTRKDSDSIEFKDSCNVNSLSENVNNISLTPLEVSQNGDSADRIHHLYLNREESTTNENQNQNSVNSRASLLAKLQSYKQRRQ